jgi:hypothetical protein
MGKLAHAGVPSVLVAFLYSDHGYDAAWESLGGQITRHVVAEFLDR